MRHGFVKVAAATPDISVADCRFNREAVLKCVLEAAQNGASVIVCPELCLTGYTCGDLFLQELLPRNAADSLLWLLERTSGVNALILAGLPIAHQGRLYNAAAVMNRGRLLGLVPKTYLPNYGEFYEERHFTRGMEEPVDVHICGVSVPMGTRMIFSCREYPQLRVGVEICEDLWAPDQPSIRAALSGATLIANLSASDETVGKDGYRRDLVRGQSARLICGYVYSSAGNGESTQDVVFSGHCMIAENGVLLAESPRFSNGIVYAQIDVARMESERARMTTFEGLRREDFRTVEFSLEPGAEPPFERYVDPAPFVPEDAGERGRRCEEILSIQTMGLKKRLSHTRCENAVVGISGGLDSTLALLVTVRAFDALGLPRNRIDAVTMPGFGTTDRTYENALGLIRSLGASLREIPIAEAVKQHFDDIGHDISVHDVTYENSQARERTQILMDIANAAGGLVIGTGDMSELALGWATYNGDHMSMYAVNCGVPKTLVRHLVRFYADTCNDAALSGVLYDILDTPVSPELLPPENGTISQRTEDLVGPYELHDFFLYQMLRCGFSPSKVYFLARAAFSGTYRDSEILKWLNVFYRRFFSQQFKRSCIPDGPKAGSVALSPRGDLRMPSDASARMWLEELESLTADD